VKVRVKVKAEYSRYLLPVILSAAKNPES